jgi:hypothetical protein
MWPIWASGACDRKTVRGVYSTIPGLNDLCTAGSPRINNGMLTTENTNSTEKNSACSVLYVVYDNGVNHKL